MIQWARNPVGSNRRFFDDFIGWIGREIYHFARVKLNSEWGRFFWVIFGGIGQKPCAEGHFAHRGRKGFGLCLAGLQREPSARLMEPTGIDGLWEKENE